MAARPLHELLADLASEASDPAEVLREGGHGELADDLIAEAIVSYADSAPVEVAEHLAPFVTGHSVVPVGDPVATLDVGEGLRLLATAPEVAHDPGAELDSLPGAELGGAPGAAAPDAPAEPELAFGEGGGDEPFGLSPAGDSGESSEPPDGLPAAGDPFDLDLATAIDPDEPFTEPPAAEPSPTEPPAEPERPGDQDGGGLAG